MTFNPQQWNTTTVDNGNSQAPEPGTYEVLLQDARAFTSRAGDDYVALDLKVATGAEAGHEWTELRSFKNDNAVKATKATVARLGVTDIDEIASLDEFDAKLKHLIGTWYAVDVKQNGEYRNVYFNGVVSNTPAMTSDVPADTSDFQPATAGPVAEDDIPF